MSDMDLNYTLYREQVERVRAGLAGSDPAKAAHQELADRYRQQIDEYRHANQALAARPRLS
jgi:hypothetical protein